MAIISISECPATPVKLWICSPEVGDTVTAVGFGKREYAERRTKVLKVEEAKVSTTGGSYPSLIRIETVGRLGDSGGALLLKGRLVGVHVLGNGHDGWEVPVETVARISLKDKGGGGSEPHTESRDRVRADRQIQKTTNGRLETSDPRPAIKPAGAVRNPVVRMGLAFRPRANSSVHLETGATQIAQCFAKSRRKNRLLGDFGTPT